MDMFVTKKKRTWRTVGSYHRDHHEEKDRQHHQSIRNGCEEIPHPSLHTVDKRLSDSDLLKSRSQPQGMSFLRQMKSESNITASMNVKEQLDIHKLVIHPRKQVHFNPVCRVVLIPERIEYHGLEKDLFWTLAELKAFRQSAFKDISMIIQNFKLNFKDITKSMMNLSLVFQFKSELDISAAEEAEASEADMGSDNPSSPCLGCSRSIQEIMEAYPLPFASTHKNK